MRLGPFLLAPKGAGGVALLSAHWQNWGLGEFLSEAQEEIAALAAALVQASGRLGAQRVRQLLFALVLFVCQRAGHQPSRPAHLPSRPRRLTRAQALHVQRCRRRTQVIHRRVLAAAIRAQRPVRLRSALPLPRAYPSRCLPATH